MKKNIFIILFLFIIGLVLRIIYAGAPLWYDEACSWATAVQGFPSGIMRNLLNTDLQHTPLYFFLLHYWMKIFGASEFAMRFLSLIFGVLTVPLTFILANKITSKSNAFFAGLVCCVCPLLVLFSSEVRMYSAVVFLVLLSLNYLTDFEQKNDKKSLIKLVITNILIPYTFVGGILYNLSLIICYSHYLIKNNKEKLHKYLKYEKIEWLCLIPYFILIFYYAKMRSLFVISHEGALRFAYIIDVIRNFFGATIENNVYWVNDTFTLTFGFCLLVIVPCVYFIWGYIKTLKDDNGFIKFLSILVFANFAFTILFSALKVNVFTCRYILYVLPMAIILSVIGLREKLSQKHFKIFLILFILCSGVFSIKNAKTINTNKETAFKISAIECAKLGLNSNDVVIMPFGSDAPYYFRDLTAPVAPNFDFHKIARNPYGVYYDNNQQKVMKSNKKYDLIYKKIGENDVFSNKFYKYFKTNVTNNVSKGRYAVLIMYGTDNNAIINIDDLRKQIKDIQYVKSNTLDVLFKKYMCDIAAMLNADFNFVNVYQSGNFTYYIYQKKN